MDVEEAVDGWEPMDDGPHDFRPSCMLESVLLSDPDDPMAVTGRDEAVDVTEPLVRLIDEEQCPRCEMPFDSAPIGPFHSRVTECRCIPICGWCDLEERLGGMADITYWSTAFFTRGRVRQNLANYLFPGSAPGPHGTE